MATAINGPDVKVKKPNYFWKTIGQSAGWIFNILLLLVVIAILISGVYFVWRAGRPMELPAFGGKTLYQVFAARRQAYDALEARYHEAHPRAKITHEMCYWTDVIFNIPASLPIGYFTLRAYLDSKMNLGGVVPRSIGDILPAWWSNYEMVLLSQYNHMRPVTYCNISPPTTTSR